MAAALAVVFALTVLFLPSAMAFTGANEEVRGYHGNGFTSADIAILATSATHYLILTCMSGAMFVTTPKGRRAACTVLFLSLLCALVETVAAIFTLVIYAGGISTGDSIAQLVLTFFTVAAGNWMLPLLFLSVCFLLHERVVFTKLWVDTQGGRGVVRLRTILAVYWTLFALLMLAGTALVIFFVSYQRLVWSSDGDDDGGFVLSGFGNGGQFSVLAYGFTTLWYATPLFIGPFAYYAYSLTRRLSSMDKSAHLLFFRIVPAYIVLVLQDLIFMIIFSVPPYNDPSANTQGVSLASTLCFNVAFCVITALLVSLVFKNAKLYSVTSSLQDLQLNSLASREGEVYAESNASEARVRHHKPSDQAEFVG